MALGGARVNSSVALKLVSICCSGFYQLLSENTITAAAGLSMTQSFSVKMPIAEQPIILVQQEALVAALMADSGLDANSELKNNNTQADASNSPLLIPLKTAAAASSGSALRPTAKPVAIFISLISGS